MRAAAEFSQNDDGCFEEKQRMNFKFVIFFFFFFFFQDARIFLLPQSDWVFSETENIGSKKGKLLKVQK